MPAGATEVSSDPLRDPGRGDLHGDREPGPDGWGLTGIAPNGGVVTIVEDTSEVTVTNTAAPARWWCQKVAAGDPDRHQPGVYRRSELHNGFSDEVALDTSGDGAASELVGPIPSGVTCTVTEPTTPDGWSLVEHRTRQRRHRNRPGPPRSA